MSSAGEDFRASVVEHFDVEAGAPDDRLVLDQLCILLDELEGLEAAIEEHGMLVRGGNGQLTANPALAAARQHRLAVAKLTAQLGLKDDSPGTRSARHAANARWAKP
jgi:phage terminase small subunit